jgi:hypothetical protein
VKIAQFADQGSCPAINVSFFHNCSQANHPVHSFRRAHIQRCEYRISEAFRVVRTHNERVGQFTGRACERTQDKDSILIMAAGDELFGNQVHSIVQ